ALHFGRRERIAKLAVATVGVAFGVHVGADYPGVVPAIIELTIPLGSAIRPRAYAAAWLAVAIARSRILAGLPALAIAHAHRRLFHVFQRRHQFLRVAHLLHQLFQFLRRIRERFRPALFVAVLHLLRRLLQMLGHFAIIVRRFYGLGHFVREFLKLLGREIR